MYSSTWTDQPQCNNKWHCSTVILNMTSSKLFERVLQVLFAAHHFQCWATSAQEVFLQELCQHCLPRHSGHICRPDVHCSQSAPLQKMLWLFNHAGELLQLYCMVIRRYSLQYMFELGSIECNICRLYGPALYTNCSAPELGLKPCPSYLFWNPMARSTLP